MATANPARIVHMTTVHKRDDIRIFLKQCRSLAAAGHDVTLIVADGRGDEDCDGIHIRDVGKANGRLGRMLGATRSMLGRARSIDADLYHLHDPELLPVGLALKRPGKRVIFDAHEDLPQQILSKPYLKPYLRDPISRALSLFEHYASRRLDAVIAATPAIEMKFRKLGAQTGTVNNYPLPGDLENSAPLRLKANEVSYVGGIAAIRGIKQVVDAMGMLRSGARLNLAGPFSEAPTRAAVEASPGWSKVDELGVLSRRDVRDVLARSLAGIVTFLPEPNHIEAQPNKMFEYMSAGLPVIASDFPLWRDIIEGSKCGICVDPLDPRAIAEAIDRVVENPAMAREMGQNGLRAVHDRYNWQREEKVLLAFYDKLLAA